LPKQQALTIATGDAALIARRYALALYELAQEQNKLETIAGDLRLLKLCLQENAEFGILASQPRLSRTQIGQALAKLTAAKLDALTLNYLGLIAQKGRLSSLAAMIDAFMMRLETARGEYTADVTVARPLPEDLQAKLAKRLQELAGARCISWCARMTACSAGW